MGYVIAAYFIVLAAIAFYWWSLWSRHQRLRREAGAGAGQRSGERERAQAL